MASLSLSHFLITLSIMITFLSQSFVPVQPSEDLITKLCSKTEEPVICRDCLNSEAKSGDKADSHALAIAAVNCAQTDTSYMYRDVFRLYNETPENNTKLKSFLNECSWRTMDACMLFDAVLRYAAASDYDSAKIIVTENVVPQVSFCLKQFDDEATSIPVPEQVLAGTVAVNQGCKIVLEIMNII